MSVTDFLGGAAQSASGSVSSIQTLVSGQTNPLASYVGNLYGLTFLPAKGAAPFGVSNDPNLLQASSLSGFAFDYYGPDEFEIDVETTDHWAEDNSSIQDHAAVGPICATLAGYVGEFVIPNPNAGVGGALRRLEQKMATAAAYAGKYTPGTVQALAGKVTGAVSTAQQYLNEVSQYAQQAQNLLAMFQSAGANRQQRALNILAAAALSRQTFTLVLPWVQVQNVLITNLRATQDGETASKSEFSVSVKQIRTTPISSSISIAG